MDPEYTRLLCPPLSLGVCSDSCPLSRWCYPTISSSVVPFSSCPQSFPASGSFPVSQLFESNGQSIGVSASASVLPKNIEDWSPLGWTGWISLQSKGLSRVITNTTVWKHQFFSAQLSFMIQLSRPYMTTGKSIALCVLCRQSDISAFNTVFRFVVAFLPRSKRPWMSWLQSPTSVILEPKKKNLSLLPLFPLLFATKWCDHDLSLLNAEIQANFFILLLQPHEEVL